MFQSQRADKLISDPKICWSNPWVTVKTVIEMTGQRSVSAKQKDNKRYLNNLWPEAEQI